MQHEALNAKALFSDQTPEFLKVQTIKPLRRSGRKSYVIRIRLRTAAGDADNCVLLTDLGEIPMRVEKENAHFIYFSAEVESDGTPVRYAFRIRLAGTGEEFLYKRTGIEWGDAENGGSKADKSEGEAGKEAGASSAAKLSTEGWWYYAPEFKIPEWANGAVMYQIFTDRFCNGDPDNDVLTGAYAYNGGQVLQIEDWYCPPAADDTREHYGGDLQGIMDTRRRGHLSQSDLCLAIQSQIRHPGLRPHRPPLRQNSARPRQGPAQRFSGQPGSGEI